MVWCRHIAVAPEVNEIIPRPIIPPDQKKKKKKKKDLSFLAFFTSPNIDWIEALTYASLEDKVSIYSNPTLCPFTGVLYAWINILPPMY